MRAAVVGTGAVGRIHARALMAHPGIELSAVCGRTRAKTDALARECGAAAYLSVGDMLERERPEIVCVCTPNDAHYEPVMSALGHGAHVLVEKPMAFRLEEAAAMVEEARRRGLRLGVDFNHRFSAPFRRARAWVDGGEVGRPCYVMVKFAGSLYDRLNDPYCQLIETQGHSFDLMRLFGGEVAEVSAYLADPRGIGVFTSAAVALRFATGAVGTLLGSWDSSYEHPAAQVLEVSGLEGRVEVTNVVDSVRLFRHRDGDYRQWRPGLFATRERDFWATIDAHVCAFVDAVAAGEEVPVSGDDGLRALELTFAAVRSFEHHRPEVP